MALEPRSSSDLQPPSISPALRVVGVVGGSIVALLLARWVFGLIWTLVRLGIFVAILVGIVYVIQQFRKSD